MKKSPLVILIFSFLVLSAINRNELIKYNSSKSADASTLPPDIALTVVALGPIKGFISNLLWLEATDKQDEKEFFDCLQVSKWISQVQPNNPDVWKYISWNMSFNISGEFSELEEKWQWIDRGFNMLRNKAYLKNNNTEILSDELASIIQTKLNFSGQKQEKDYYYNQYSKQIYEQIKNDSLPLKDKLFYDQVVDELELKDLGPSSVLECFYYLTYPENLKDWRKLSQSKSLSGKTFRTVSIELLRFGKRIQLPNGNWYSFECTQSNKIIDQVLKSNWSESVSRSNRELLCYLALLSNNNNLLEKLNYKPSLDLIRQRHKLRMEKLEIPESQWHLNLIWEANLAFENGLMDSSKGRFKVLKTLYPNRRFNFDQYGESFKNFALENYN